MHLCQFAITINLSCNFCKTDVVVSIFSLSFFLFFSFFFFADNGVQLCEGVRVHSSCRFLSDAPPLGLCNVRTFSRMVASSHWRAFSVVSRSSIHSITLSQPRFFFFFQLLIPQHQCSYIHVFTIFTERE